MYTVNLIADYVIFKLSSDESQGVVNLKLQKLMYYIQAWYLAFKGDKLFDSNFQAWVHGPVSRPLYDRFKESKGLYSFITIQDVLNTEQFEEIAEKDRIHIDTVLETYAPYSATDLEVMSHREDPWIETRKGLSTFQRCEKDIDNELIGKYYAKRLSSSNG